MSRSRLFLASFVLALVGGALLFVALRGAGREVPPTSLTLRQPERVDGPSATTPEARTDPESQSKRVAPMDPATVVEPAPAERGAFLRVVGSDGAPAADFALIVAFATRRADGVEALTYGNHELTTDERGALDLTTLLDGLAGLDERDKQEVLVVLGARDELTPSVLARHALGATRDSAAVVVRTPRALAPLRGVAVDAATGVPLADYPLRIFSWRDARPPMPSPGLALTRPEALQLYQRVGSPVGEWLTTDAAGRFESRTALPPSLVNFMTYEKHHLDAEHRIDEHGHGEELRLEIETGPIVLLDLDPPEGYVRTDFIAALRRDGNEHPAYIDELTWPGDAHAGQRGGSSGNAGPVRDGPPPWVRLPRTEVEHNELPAFLVLESRDRRCYGSALYDDFERHTTEPLRVELATREMLELRVEWPPDDTQGRALDRLLVTLTPADAGPEAEPTVAEWVSRWDHEPVTSKRLVGFAPGRQRLAAGTRNLPFDEVAAVPLEREVEVPRAEPLVLTPRLAASVATHDIEIVVRTASGAALDGREGRAQLTISHVLPRGFGGGITWSGGVGRVVVRDVPEGPVQLQPLWSRGWFPLEPADATFEAPGESLELLVRDDLPAEELVVRVIEPQVGGRVTIQLGSGRHRNHHAPRFGLDELVALPDGRRAYVLSSGPYLAGTEVARVELSMEGHERVWLTGSELPPPDAQGRRVVELDPRRGWSARVQVVTSLDDGVAPEPAPALVLAFDGLETPPSDDEGRLVHRASAQPERVTLVTPGWQLVSRTSYLGRGTVHADGRVNFEDGELTVLVRRAP